jgi:sirohydrochlorin ferrochelatase
VRAADVIGADPGLLPILDERLRTALRTARVRELDAMVLASSGCNDPRLNVAVARLARLWSARHHLPTSIAFADTYPPSPGEAVREWRRRGKRHIAVGSLFLTSGPSAERAAELALEAGACAVSSPLGAHQDLSRLIVARYSVSALLLVPV